MKIDYSPVMMLGHDPPVFDSPVLQLNIFLFSVSTGLKCIAIDGAFDGDNCVVGCCGPVP